MALSDSPTKATQRIVIALGGNALGNSLSEQMEAAKTAASALVDLAQAGHEIAVIHGNGPQVGMIVSAFELAAEVKADFGVLPMSVCVALSQGYIGYDLQNVIRAELDSRGMDTPVCTLITQVVVDPDDPAFDDPSKPIGKFMSAEEAQTFAAEGFEVREDSGRGWRRVVASPKPLDVIESESIRALMAAGQIPIVCGGGGIPVAYVDGQYRGQSAVIDKDFTAAKLADIIDADLLMILTAVDKVAIGFGTPQQLDLDYLTVAQAREYCDRGEFGRGSMEPKVQAAIAFVSSGKKREALITELKQARAAVSGTTGTRITL